MTGTLVTQHLSPLQFTAAPQKSILTTSLVKVLPKFLAHAELNGLPALGRMCRLPSKPSTIDFCTRTSFPNKSSLSPTSQSFSSKDPFRPFETLHFASSFLLYHDTRARSSTLIFLLVRKSLPTETPSSPHLDSLEEFNVVHDFTTLTTLQTILYFQADIPRPPSPSLSQYFADPAMSSNPRPGKPAVAPLGDITNRQGGSGGGGSSGPAATSCENEPTVEMRFTLEDEALSITKSLPASTTIQAAFVNVEAHWKNRLLLSAGVDLADVVLPVCASPRNLADYGTLGEVPASEGLITVFNVPEQSVIEGTYARRLQDDREFREMVANQMGELRNEIGVLKGRLEHQGQTIKKVRMDLDAEKKARKEDQQANQRSQKEDKANFQKQLDAAGKQNSLIMAEEREKRRKIEKQLSVTQNQLAATRRELGTQQSRVAHLESSDSERTINELLRQSRMTETRLNTENASLRRRIGVLEHTVTKLERYQIRNVPVHNKLRKRALLDYARDAASQRLGYKSWFDLLETKGWTGALNALKFDLDEPVPGWDSRIDFVNFIVLGTTFTREEGNRAAHNYRQNKILKAVRLDTTSDKANLETIVRVVDEWGGWWNGPENEHYLLSDVEEGGESEEEEEDDNE
ncbi:hypothetical protein BJ508DRAFT_303322 [Ascobolus immersus RN42]|uniref:Uncharacterized protein n=1 Tax=Ascobolus immersus RN42 TaxID=1160509 RepID=A0A3N4IFJ9_ASCIM|nr:hypothetical protein BJ508DRAFT_303322 [Ascobolus immersus RN42]